MLVVSAQMICLACQKTFIIPMGIVLFVSSKELYFKVIFNVLSKRVLNRVLNRVFVPKTSSFETNANKYLSHICPRWHLLKTSKKQIATSIRVSNEPSSVLSKAYKKKKVSKKVKNKKKRPMKPIDT